MRTEVSVSVSALGVDVVVSTGRGVKVRVKAGIGVRVSDGEMLVDVFTTMGEEDAVGLSLLRLHARVVVIKRMRKYEFLIFITSLY
jgi:hypothetical protein